MKNFEMQLNDAMNLPKGALQSLKIAVKSTSKDSRDDKCLQVADYIAAICFQKTENSLNHDFDKISTPLVPRQKK